MGTTKRKAIPKKVREQVYKMYDGHCAYCGCELEYKDMQVDHVIAFRNAKFKKYDADYIDSIDNYMPTCRSCNYYKRARGLESMRKDIGRLYIQLERSFDYRLAKKYGLIKETPHDIKFYFENHEKSC